jgi:hypothetical protein
MSQLVDTDWEPHSVDVGEFPFELTPDELANACRRAYLRLVVGAHIGWGKVEVARWLTGPYRRLTVREASWVEQPPPSVTIANDIAPASALDDRLVNVLEQMRFDVLIVMRELSTPEGLSAFTTLAFDTNLVARAREEDGGFAVLPCARPRMTLTDRVLSLVAVDAITRPEDFEHSLFVCSRCDQPVFDVASRPRGICRTHVSGIEST